MFNHRQNLKKLVCSCLLIVGCLVPAISGLAAEAGSIQISYHGRTDDETVVLSDTPFVLYHAGGWSEGGWTLSEDFQGSGVSLENPDSSERKEQAEKLYAYAVKEKLQGREQKTDKAGITKFENLEKGLYLIAQTRKIRKGDLEFYSSPFLVCMPGNENGEEVWELTIEPKVNGTILVPEAEILKEAVLEVAPAAEILVEALAAEQQLYPAAIRLKPVRQKRASLFHHWKKQMRLPRMEKHQKREIPLCWKSGLLCLQSARQL